MIYMDHAATTTMRPCALWNMQKVAERFWGNPSSVHAMGREAAQELEQCRQMIADCINCDPAEVFFTSGATESCNWIIRHLHSRFLNCDNAIYGNIKQEHAAVYEAALAPHGELPTLTVCMLANNETGQIFQKQIMDVKQLSSLHMTAPLFVDATAAAGHILMDFKELGCSYMAFSGHKFGAAKGVGCLIAKTGSVLSPMLVGGYQEGGFRAGTENLPGIASMAYALKNACDNMTAEQAKVIRLRDELILGIKDIPDCVLNGAWTKGLCTDRLPGNVNFSFRGVDGEKLVTMLDIDYGICASSGSACHSGKGERSRVIYDLHHDDELARGSLRLTLSHQNTMDEVETVISAVKECVRRLRQS